MIVLLCVQIYELLSLLLKEFISTIDGVEISIQKILENTKPKKGEEGSHPPGIPFITFIML